MNPVHAEKDEDSISSPVLSTKNNLSVFTSTHAKTNKLEIEDDDADLCSPVLHQKFAKKFKLEKSVNENHPTPLRISTKKSIENASDSLAKNGSVRSSRNIPETESSKDSCFLSSRKLGVAADKVVKTNKVHLYSHDVFDGIKNHSKSSSILKDQEDPFNFASKKKGSPPCSPEIKLKQRTLFSESSPEVKIKKICLSSSRKRKPKHCEDVENRSRPEKTAATNSSNNISSKRKLIEEKPSKLYQNTEKNFNSENQCFSVALKANTAKNNDYFKVNQNKLSEAIGQLQSIYKADVDSLKQDESKSSSISSGVEIISDSQSDSKTTEEKSVPQSDLPTSPILKIKFSTSKKVKKRFHRTSERGVGSCPIEKSSSPQNCPAKKCLLINRPEENVLNEGTKSKCDLGILPASLPAKDETQDSLQLEMNSVSPLLTSCATFKNQNLVHRSSSVMKKQGGSESSSISSTTEMIEDSQGDLKITAGKSVLQSPLPTSPILKIKFSTVEKVKKKLYHPEPVKDSRQSEKSFTPQGNFTKPCFRTCQPKENVSHQAPDTKSNYDADVSTFDLSAQNEAQISSRFESTPMASPPLTSHTISKEHNVVHSSLPVNNYSPFNENFVNFSVSSSNAANIKNVRKRLGFHSSSTEKRRNKINKPVRKLSLKKTSNLENQFSKFSEFCKLNTSLSTKSPSSLTIRKSKLKKFNANKEEVSSFRNLNYSENCCDHDRSPSPILQSSVRINPKINPAPSTVDTGAQSIDLAEGRINESRGNKEDPESCIEDQIDDDPQSPCFKTPKKFNFSKLNSEFHRTKIKSNKKSKLSLDGARNLKVSEECYDKNESLSPVLNTRKKVILESDEKVIPCNIDEDQDPQVGVIDVTVADIDDSAVDYRTILNETVLEKIPETGEGSSQANLMIENDVLSTQAVSASSKNQCSMTIEFSESSGTQQSQISDGNLPCDYVKESISSPPQSRFAPNNDDLYESGKKRKRRYKNGTLSARLNRLLNRTRSETRMWAHELQSDASNSAAIDLVVEVVSYEMNKWLLKCRFVSEPVDGSNRDVYFVILHPSAISNALITPGIILRVFPKWQTLDLPSPKVTVIFNITRVKLIQDSLSTSSSDLLHSAKHETQVAEAYCSCPRDSIQTVCVHNLLKRQLLLGPLISPGEKNDMLLS